MWGLALRRLIGRASPLPRLAIPSLAQRAHLSPCEMLVRKRHRSARYASSGALNRRRNANPHTSRSTANSPGRTVKDCANDHAIAVTTNATRGTAVLAETFGGLWLRL